MSQQRSEFLERWYEREEWRWGPYPLRIPAGGVRKYFWNEKCLTAPRPAIDKNGCYYAPPFIRRIIPGLVPMPQPIKALPVMSWEELRAITVRMNNLWKSFDTSALDEVMGTPINAAVTNALAKDFDGDYGKEYLKPEFSTVVAKMPTDWDIIAKPFTLHVDGIYPVRRKIIPIKDGV